MGSEMCIRDRFWDHSSVHLGQTATSAVAARQKWCEELPVGHFKTGQLDTLEYTPLGHLLQLQHALAEEALLAAEAMCNRELGQFNVRGGPWHGARLGWINNKECRKVASIAYRWRGNRAVARAEVLVSAVGRPDTSSLRRHIAKQAVHSGQRRGRPLGGIPCETCCKRPLWEIGRVQIW